MVKMCSKCGRSRHTILFKKDVRYRGGFFCWCRDCESAYSKSPEVKKRNRRRYAKWIAIPENKKKELARSRARHQSPEAKRQLKDSTYRRQYGISLDTFERDVEKQKHLCKLCGRKRRLCADHDHEKNKYRGAVCWPCNVVVGHLEASPGLFKKLRRYLGEEL